MGDFRLKDWGDGRCGEAALRAWGNPTATAAELANRLCAGPPAVL